MYAIRSYYVVETAANKAGQVCFPSALEDGTEVLLRSTPRYRDDTTGVEGTAVAACPAP